MTTGARIQERIESLGLTQGEVSRLMKAEGHTAWHQTTVSRAISGERPLRLDEAYPLARILGTTVDYLAGQDEHRSASPIAVAALEQAIVDLTRIKEQLGT